MIFEPKFTKHHVPELMTLRSLVGKNMKDVKQYILKSYGDLKMSLTHKGLPEFTKYDENASFTIHTVKLELSVTGSYAKASYLSPACKLVWKIDMKKDSIKYLRLLGFIHSGCEQEDYGHRIAIIPGVLGEIVFTQCGPHLPIDEFVVVRNLGNGTTSEQISIDRLKEYRSGLYLIEDTSE